MRALLVSLFVLMTIYSYAQDSLEYRSYVPNHAVKFSPFHLINFYPTLELSYEKRIYRWITLQGEYGYVIDYGDRTDASYRNKRGSKFKLEVRKYFAPVTYRNLIFYGALEGYMNAIRFDERYTTQECFGEDCDHVYIRDRYYTTQYHEQGFGFKFGLVKYFLSNFFMDVNSGWCIRFVDYDKMRPDNIQIFNSGVEEEGWGIDIPNEHDRVVPSPVLGIRIGYRFR
ncbi:MAG TPA: hypothetical protein VIN08_21820 [Ohtaekwangia sp.]|uniref:hypothetical protein n=1 Tax=Ohtaekwangia sp. TaxID=2066019 RepID=UPI002F93B4C5